MTDNVETIIDFLTGSFIGLLAWFFGGLDGIVLVLITFAVIDQITGIIAACVLHKLSSEVGFKGIARKVTMFMYVGMAHLLDQYLPGDTGSLRTVVCLFYVVNEGISIIENGEKMGVTIPIMLHNWLIKLHSAAMGRGSKDDTGKESQTKSDTETKQESK